MGTIIQIITGIGFILFASFAEGIELKERYGLLKEEKRRRLSILWHWLQLLERVFAIIFGIAVGMTGLTITSVKVILFIAACFWVIYDGIINLYAGRKFFEVSNTTTWSLERYGEYKYKILVLLTAIAILFLGCSTAERTIIKSEVQKVASPVIEDTIRAVTVTDTVVIAQQVIRRDTVIDVRYYPKKQKFYIRAKPDTVLIEKTDTIKLAEKKEVGYREWTMQALIIIGGIILAWFIAMIWKTIK